MDQAERLPGGHVRQPILAGLFVVVAAGLAAAAELDPGGEVRFNIGSFSPWTFYDAREDDEEFLLQRTRLNLRASLNEHLSGLIEVQAFGDFGRNEANLGLWWPDRRDDHVADEDIWLYQGYVAIDRPADIPISLKLGKQELTYGQEFLLGNNDTGDMFFGNSFDAIKGSGQVSELTLDLFLARLDDNRFLLDVGEDVSPSHHQITDTNATLYGLYGTWTGFADRLGLRAIDGYLLSVQIGDYNEGLAGLLLGLDHAFPAPYPGHGNMDGRHGWLGTFGGWFPAGRWDTNPSGWWGRRNVGDGSNAAYLALAGADTLAGDVGLHTAGFRLEGALPGEDRALQLDYELEYARQFGPTGRPEVADSSQSTGRYSGSALDFAFGLEFSQVAWRPRLSGGYTFFSGGPGANRIDASGARAPEDEVGTFQRLWSDKQYGENLDRAPFGVFLTNVQILQAGLGADVTTNTSLRCDFFHYTVDEPRDPNGPVFGANPEANAGGNPVNPTVGARAAEPDDDLGSEIDLFATYYYHEDLRFTAGYAVFLNGATLADQTPSDFQAADNQHYVFLDVRFAF
jgi:hypothetical protein